MKNQLLKLFSIAVALFGELVSEAQTTYNYTGSVQTFVVPFNGSYSIEAWGAEGGNSFSKSQNAYVNGGKGGYVKRNMNLTAGQTLYIYVGGQGDTHTPTTTGSVAGGYNGGGASSATNTYGGGGGGGGASHVATATGLLNTLSSNKAAVIVVAGGGGGAWACNYYSWTNYRDASDGGNGGDTLAQGAGYGYTMGYCSNSANNNIFNQADSRSQAYNYATGGSQNAGGIQGCASPSNPFYTTSVPSAFGLGASSGNASQHSGGGGGGGWYGGGAGASGENANGTGGGGGSSYNANDTSGVHTQGVRSGDGQVVITALCPSVAPTVTCPSNITVNNDAGNCTAVVNYTAPTDACATITQTAGLPSGSAFPVGTTVNKFVATNSFGSDSCTFTVTVVDNEKPTIMCPSNITVNNDSSMCDAVVNYTAPVGTDNCSGVTTVMTSGLASGSTFPVGTTTVVYTVTDAANNIDSCSFIVTVVDAEAPIITCPSNVQSCDSVINGLTPSASDNCSGVAITYTLSGATVGSGNNDASGMQFNVGVTSLTYIAADSSGNKDSCVMSITVNAPPLIVLNKFNQDSICLNSNSVNLPAVSPTGGTFSGPGVGGGKFNPSIAGVGSHHIVYVYTDNNGCTNSDSVMITVDGCVGIQENGGLRVVKLYPNPVKDNLILELSELTTNTKLTLYDINGKEVLSEKIVSTITKIDMSVVTKGMYILKVGTQVFRVVKQ